MARPKPIVLAVLDGWGIAPNWGGNAVTLARTPFINMAEKNYPFTPLQASGEWVGLPHAERGNSEVGHLNIGSGQIVQESFPAITSSIADGTFFKNPVLIKAFQRAKQNNKAVHIMGLVSDGGIHSHINHLYALLDMAKQQSVTNVFIHAFTDGRDTPPFNAQEYLAHLNTKLQELGFGAVVTVEGRYYAMDRDHRWDRVEKVYRAITEGVGQTIGTAEGAVALAYRDGYSDEFIPPTVVEQPGRAFPTLQDGDSFIFFNFRGDRAREITQSLVVQNFDGFNRRRVIKDLFFVGFTYYQEGLPIEVAFKPRDVKEPLSYVLSKNNIKQLHVAETEKYAHVTYFFNGGQETEFPNEQRILIPSPKVGSYDQVPEMSTAGITQAVIDNINNYDFIILNYACPDMVGHTGNLRATIQACEAVDKGMQRIYEVISKINGLLIVTADHGNAEQMVNPRTGEPDTEHSNNPVPFVITGAEALTMKLRDGGALSDVAPTILDIMGLQPSSEMTGKTLIIHDQPVVTTPAVEAVAAPAAA